MLEYFLIAIYLYVCVMIGLRLATRPPFFRQGVWFVILFSITATAWILIYFSDDLGIELTDAWFYFPLAAMLITFLQGIVTLILLLDKRRTPPKNKEISSLYSQMERTVHKLARKKNCTQIYAIILKCYDGGRIDFCYATEAMYQKTCSRTAARNDCSKTPDARYNVEFFRTLPLDYEFENGFRRCNAHQVTRYIEQLRPALAALDTTEDFVIYMEIVNADPAENEKWKQLTIPRHR